jgi:hypothetical protein
MLKVQVNAKAAGHTKLGKPQRMFGLFWAVLK